MSKLRIRRRKYEEFLQVSRRAKRALVAQIVEDLGTTVLAGPLTGTELKIGSTWGVDLIAQLFGFYEQQLLEHLVDDSAKARKGLLVDVGAADGYWAVGLVRSGHFERAICFETRLEGQTVIREMAALNNVSDRIDVFGEASAPVLLDCLRKNKPDTLLIDVEGAEFDLLTSNVIKTVGACVVAELHPDGAEADATDRLVSRLEKAGFETDMVTDAKRDCSALLEAVDLHDSLRALLLSEGRGRPQSWAVARRVSG